MDQYRVRGLGIPWQPGDWDSVLSLLGDQVQYLVGEQNSTSCTANSKKKKKKIGIWMFPSLNWVM